MNNAVEPKNVWVWAFLYFSLGHEQCCGTQPKKKRKRNAESFARKRTLSVGLDTLILRLCLRFTFLDRKSVV